MKKFPIFVLSVVLSGAGLYFADRVEAICQMPLEYRLGELDDRFNLTPEEALVAVDDAVAVWENTIGKDLFVYNPEAQFTINFIFDERQAESDAESEALTKLEEEKQKLNASTAQYEESKKKLTAQQETFTFNNENYERDIAAYNQEVERYNESGGAPPDEYEELEEEKDRLERVAKKLQEDADTLTGIVDEVNAASAAHNAAVTVYNQHVRDFNDAFAGGREFTQGDYQGKAIHIYSFQTNDELRLVLAHELGHALSLGHVDDSEAVMYFMLGDESDELSLGAADIREFEAWCGEGMTWWQKLRTLFPSISGRV